MTPVFGHGHLRLYLLSLLSERPMHGYELIQALSDRFGGTYIPSAGTIYPRLAKLGEEGLVTREADGRKTVYSITDAGRVELASRRAELDDIENGVTATVRSLADEVRLSVNDAMRTLRADLAAAARGVKAESADASESATTPPTASAPESPVGSEPDSAAGAESESHSDPAAPHSTGRSEGMASRQQLRDAELALTEFRHRVQAELRSRAARNTLPEDTAARLRDRLDSALTGLFE
ncbi:PadR family transcriptional regulator [Salinibacterium hongtaonis]|uniref:PadR family transcriptional regulator n=1 Tax=Homoserinimonas hongtaonis TaxID=2079791 RepID=UPI000D34F7A1|nr:PadR family transcriptional regulator [Salinibacterium hongtaonis]AWB90172.1 PadR family transcriptional regulator [Salinibacterium hongtaonis]